MFKIKHLILLFLAVLVIGCQVKEQPPEVNKCPSGTELIKLYKPSSPGGFQDIFIVYNDGSFYHEEGKGPALEAVKRSSTLTADDLASLKENINSFDWETYELEQSIKLENKSLVQPTLTIPSLDKEFNALYDPSELPDFLREVFGKYDLIAEVCE